MLMGTLPQTGGKTCVVEGDSLESIDASLLAYLDKEKVSVNEKVPYPSEIPNVSTHSVKLHLSNTDWLTRSTAAILKTPASSNQVLEALKCIDCNDVQVPTCCTKPWNGESSSLSRIVWINCRGMPLSAWSNSSFRIIGELWGVFLGLEEYSIREAMSFDVGKMLIVAEKENKIIGDLEVSLSPQSSGKDVDGVMENTKVRDSLGEDKADNPYQLIKSWKAQRPAIRWGRIR
ncbi:hypothetical protein RHSIM_Rhsim10G0108900 [Rhododendron simsii]|uniref:DUF4283 domain-containing protein n=1 Tax=Rhododendron simsii TaxID=118357 RepID=A0A834L9A8_RHOSS|nr:hypothetical protein RHSIM_Rhsim10G0108900 [Rhododendron simsii]